MCEQLQCGYQNEAELLNEFKQHMQDPNSVELAADYLLSSLIDELILGSVFEVHQAQKLGITDALDGSPEDTEPFSLVDLPDYDVFGSSNSKKPSMDCVCPNCDRPVAAARFAPHLEKCLGRGRNSSRIASRRIASSREGSSYFGGNMTDEEDDWAGERRKKKMPAVRSGGSKKANKAS